MIANPKPTLFDLGPLKNIYISGAATGLAMGQNHPALGDDTGRADVSNAQVFIQNTSGLFQFFVQVGAYSLPAIGTPYLRAEKATEATYGAVPQAFLKIAPNDSLSFQIGKLPTLQGAESTFTFENMNISRGLLWNQENAVNRGVQVNYSQSPWTLSLSLNDGYYSGRYSWLSGLISYTASPRDTLTFVGAGNTSVSSRSTYATPLLQNNSQLYDVIYTHVRGPLTVTPYIQYTYIAKNPSLGISRSASTFAGAVLARYALTSDFSLAGRAEFITTTGRRNSNDPNLLYGAGSDAWSLTFTPTYQHGVFFARADLSYVRATGVTSGLGFGGNLSDRDQARGLLEVGVLY